MDIHFQICPSSSRRRIFVTSRLIGGCWPLPAKFNGRPGASIDGDGLTGICSRTSKLRLTISDVSNLLSQGFQKWECGKEYTLSPAITTVGLEFATDSKYVDKLLVIYLLTGDNIGHTAYRGVMDQMATMNSMAENGFIHENDGVHRPLDGDDRLIRQCMARFDESNLFKAYDALHPVARCRLELFHTDYITARTEAEPLQGKFISSWVNPKVDGATLTEGMCAFPSVFAGGKIEADCQQTAVGIIDGSIAMGYTMYALFQLPQDIASALMHAETSAVVENGELATDIDTDVGNERGMRSSILRGMLGGNGAKVFRAEDGTFFVMGAYP